ncbi:hypothetical protein JI750_16140 [Flavobacterium sp. GN10]|uniref:DUF3592 domain-containing protein n=1 Tax=Flavobacterium tagetis TaxID=2801336 RepID=A0ABS1KIF9_9FLAO|nr:hypothetical protein [Flavobacterium tagetis]MBL0738427.1 hypothetical protein [Flavobacterium tagetis]
MENRKKILNELMIRLGLIVITILLVFFSISFTIDIFSDFSIYLNRDEYKRGNMIVTRIGEDSYGSPHLFANGKVENIKTSIYLGLEKEVEIKNYYPILYKRDGKQSFLITKDFEFDPTKYLYYGISKIFSIVFFLFIISKIYKYFKNDKLKF